MNDKSVFSGSPLANYDYSFDHYLKKRKAMLNASMDGNGVPNYAYKTDYELRKKLDSTPGLFNIARNLTATTVSRMMQIENLSSLAVGPHQFPEVYSIACDCAKRLGIGVPNIYIEESNELNAWTYAYDDGEPIVVVTSLMLKRMTLGELKAVIGHECGHIQNYHSLYSTVCQILFEGGIVGGAVVAPNIVAPLINLLTAGVSMTLKMWTRAAEVTADRAALICCDNIEDALRVNKKFLYGAVEVDDKIDTRLDLDSLRAQMEMSMNNPMRLYELNADHPLSIKRLFAQIEFSECETFYKWRPDFKTPGCVMRSKEETDLRCKKYIDVIKGKGDKK